MADEEGFKFDLQKAELPATKGELWELLNLHGQIMLVLADMLGDVAREPKDAQRMKEVVELFRETITLRDKLVIKGK